MSEEETGDEVGEEIGQEFEEPEAETELGEEDSTEDEGEFNEPQGEVKQPALVINVHSWATPIVGLLMLVVGLLAGYFIRPLIPLPGQAETPVAAAPTNTPPTESPAQAAAATQPPVDLQEVMDLLKSQVRHYKGDPNAPVTLIEFSDFQ